MLRIEPPSDPTHISELFSVLITPMSCALVGETQEISIRKNSLAYRIYQKESVTEKYNCSYSLNEDHRARFAASDLQIVGVNSDGDVRMVELSHHRFFLAMLFQPQLSAVASTHPVIVSFLEEAGK